MIYRQQTSSIKLLKTNKRAQRGRAVVDRKRTEGNPIRVSLTC